MPVSGLVVTFDAPVARHVQAIDLLGAIPEVELGNTGGSKLAIVVDSATKQRDQEVWNAVLQLPGVIDLAVAMIAFEEADGEEVAPLVGPT